MIKNRRQHPQAFLIVYLPCQPANHLIWRLLLILFLMLHHSLIHYFFLILLIVQRIPSEFRTRRLLVIIIKRPSHFDTFSQFFLVRLRCAETGDLIVVLIEKDPVVD